MHKDVRKENTLASFFTPNDKSFMHPFIPTENLRFEQDHILKLTNEIPVKDFLDF